MGGTADSNVAGPKLNLDPVEPPVVGPTKIAPTNTGPQKPRSPQSPNRPPRLKPTQPSKSDSSGITLAEGIGIG